MFAESAVLDFNLVPTQSNNTLGFGPQGGQGGPVVADWFCKVDDLYGKVAVFKFEIILEDCPLILGLDYDQNANTTSLESPPTWSVRLDGKEFTFGVYIARDVTGNFRRFVQFRPNPTTLLAGASRARRNQGAVKLAQDNPQRFALRLHGWGHLPLEQMQKLARQASLLTPEVNEQLTKVVERCDVCPLTGSNVGSAGLRRVSLTKHVHPEGNRLVEIDHVSHVVSMSPRVRERLCLSMACNSTGYGETPFVASKGLEHAVTAVEHSWVLRHGAPESIAADPGLGGRVMREFCDAHSITWEPRPPRRHNTIGVVERRNGVMRMILARLVAGNDSLTEAKRVTDDLLIERANFLANLLLGDATLSSFQLLKGYQPSLIGIPATELSAENVRAHLEVRTTRAISRLLRSKSFSPYRKPPLQIGQRIYVHTQRHTGSSRGAVGWAQHEIYRIDDSMVATRPIGRTTGRMNLTSFADIRVPPQDALAQEAFNFALSQPFPRVGRWEGDEAQDEDPEALDGTSPLQNISQRGELQAHPVTEAPPPAPAPSLPPVAASGPARTEPPAMPALQTPPVLSTQARLGPPETEALGQAESRAPAGFPAPPVPQPAQPVPQAVPVSQPRRSSRLRTQLPTSDKSLLADVTAFYSRIQPSALARNGDDPGDVEKDIGSVEVADVPLESELEPCDVQKMCEEILACVGRESVTRQKLGFVQPWLLDEALFDELQGWDKHIHVEPMRKGSLQHNVIGSHVLYCVKTREDGTHYLKARLVIHGNEEAEKESFRSDASSIHFTLIRVILSIAVCLGFRIGGADVSKAYHQSGGPPRHIRVRPPPECMLMRVVWLLLSLPYGLVDAGRQWQLAMEQWLLDDLGFETFAGLPQVFAKLNDRGAILLLIGKVSDDILVAGMEADISALF